MLSTLNLVMNADEVSELRAKKGGRRRLLMDMKHFGDWCMRICSPPAKD